MLSTTLLSAITIFKWDVSQVGLALYQLDRSTAVYLSLISHLVFLLCRLLSVTCNLPLHPISFALNKQLNQISFPA